MGRNGGAGRQGIRVVGLSDSCGWRGGFCVGRHLHRHYPDAWHAGVGSTGQRGVSGWRDVADVADGKSRIVAVDVAVFGRSRHRAERNILEKCKNVKMKE